MQAEPAGSGRQDARGAVTLVLAHRGSGPNGPEKENTPPAFLAAERLGADGVELDVRRGRDGALLVHHDAVLADGRPLADLAPADLPSEVPTLVEALDACADMLVNVEIKNWPGDADFDPREQAAAATAAVLLSRARAGAGGRYVVSSFSGAALGAFSARAPSIETALLVGGGDALSACRLALEAGASGIHPLHRTLGPSYLKVAREAGLAVRVWTVDDPDRIRQLAALGVDAVITNEVALACRAVADVSK